MERKTEIKQAYKSLGRAHSLYDNMMLGTNAAGRLILKAVWQMTQEDALEYQAKSFERIPADFSGSILEVPVGTGVISMPVFQTLPDADITCLDYSPKMMKSARKTAPVSDSYATYNAFSNSARGSSSIIDHIFYSVGLNAKEYKTVRDGWKNIDYISDHYPIYAIFTF